jgi:hypothetical protein
MDRILLSTRLFYASDKNNFLLTMVREHPSHPASAAEFPAAPAIGGAENDLGFQPATSYGPASCDLI